MKPTFYSLILEKKAKQERLLAILLDPDKSDEKHCLRLIQLAEENQLDFFLVGGSLITAGNLQETVLFLKKHTQIPVLLFPGSNLHLSSEADGILLLSLISGRNPEFLIGQHVSAAPFLKKSNLEIIPTGYLLINCGKLTTAAYMSNTTPIPYQKSEIAACTALAGQQLGLKMIYLDGGSGADQPISKAMISQTKTLLDIPLIVGGGIRTLEAARTAYRAGADMLVVGTSVEQNPDLLADFCALRFEN